MGFSTLDTGSAQDTLRFDEDRMVAGIMEWAECESPTWEAGAVNRMMDLASRALALMGARIERIPGRMGLGDCIRARLPHSAPDGTPGILIAAHLDTVHPLGTLKQLPVRREGDRVYGPGICDMKGGTYMAIEALRHIGLAGLATPLPVTVLLTPDEEIGTPSARDLVEAEAARNLLVLVPEPGRPDGTPCGGLVSGRHAVARFEVRTTGRPSHAGARLAAGRSAIREMCRQVLDIEAMSTERCTYSVGVIQGGQWANCVATHCDARVLLSMAETEAELQAGIARMLARRSSTPDVALTVRPTCVRPVWTPGRACTALFEHARQVARGLGFDVAASSSPGGSDGNFTGAMGVPTLDGLGILGDMYHTLEEHMLVSSIVPRTRLLAGLLLSLAPSA
ncbi:M20/M25/M40 family metallo-hydrolase [Gluconacetobacter azotocaptans]|uniref:M20/M25/M40 family metallo-hydrolase n=1 Tax=Gluconacetobacter azotocaptans TaxID=142834 RepID=UPI0019593A94|nr:M20/M25/M40 family metallo-hydrolase [Gluconacetobacter azotocaptans]MBM9403047.1 M20/M25/M40 family metallo-hydrolase [Gluconacetobacter azotocaptans]